MGSVLSAFLVGALVRGMSEDELQQVSTRGGGQRSYMAGQPEQGMPRAWFPPVRPSVRARPHDAGDHGRFGREREETGRERSSVVRPEILNSAAAWWQLGGSLVGQLTLHTFGKQFFLSLSQQRGRLQGGPSLSFLP